MVENNQTMTISTYTSASSTNAPKKNRVITEQYLTETAEVPKDGTELQHLITSLTCANPSAITYTQIEQMLRAHGYDPFDANDLYEAIIDTLQQRQILVVESLAEEQAEVDQDTVSDIIYLIPKQPVSVVQRT